jgi:hypothetical protein
LLVLAAVDEAAAAAAAAAAEAVAAALEDEDLPSPRPNGSFFSTLSFGFFHCLVGCSTTVLFGSIVSSQSSDTGSGNAEYSEK